MKLLITGAFHCTEAELKTLSDMENEVLFMQNERDALPCNPEEIEGVICNGLFLHHDIKEFSALKFIQLTSAGFDRVPMEYIKEKGIEIYNARGVYSVPIAEFTLCSVLELYKQSRFFMKNQKEHKWEKHHSLLELSGKTVAIIGAGSVGTECAKRFSSFDTTVLAVDIAKPDGACFDEFFPFENIKTAISRSDIVVLTLPLTPKTKGMFDEDMLSCFKENSVLVNMARGQIVDENALIPALNSGRLQGAVLDVFCEEPLPADSPLWDMENVIITPHNSFVGEGNNARLFEVIKTNLKNKI